MFGRAGALLQNNPKKALRGQEEEPDYHFNLSLKHTATHTMGFPGGSMVKSTLANAGDAKRREFQPWVGKIPWRRKWQPTPVFWLGKSHGERSQVGYSPRGRKELDMTEPMSTHTSCATSWNKQWINIIKSKGIAFHVPSVIYFQAWGTKSIGFSSWLLPFTSVWSQLSGPTRHTQAGEPYHLQDLVQLWDALVAFLRVFLQNGLIFQVPSCMNI